MKRTLLPYQKKWLADRAPLRVIEKSRRIGISWAEAFGAVAHAARDDGSVYYQSYDKDMTREFIDDCAGWAQYANFLASQVGESVIEEDGKTIQVYRIGFQSGREIVAMSGRPRQFRSKGRRGDIAIVDEAAFVDDLGEVLKAALAFVVWGGSVHVISTHNGDANPFNQLCADVRAGRQPGSIHRVPFDDALADGLARRVLEIQGIEPTPQAMAEWEGMVRAIYRDNADEELNCIPRQGSGVWLTRSLVEARMEDAPTVRYEGTTAWNDLSEPLRRADMEDWIEDYVSPLIDGLDRERRHVFGMDFARSGDLSVIAPLEIGATLRRRCPWLLEMKNVPHAQQMQVVRHVGRGLPRLSGAALDAGGNGSAVAEDAHDAFGSVVDQVKFSEAWYRENLPRYKAALEDAMLSIPRSDDVLQDHRAVRLIRGVPRLPEGKTDKKGDRHGDAFIALALAYHASLTGGGPIEGAIAGPSVASGLFAPIDAAGRPADRQAIDYERGIVHGAGGGMEGFN